MLEIISEKAAWQRKLAAIKARNIVFDAPLLAQVGAIIADVRRRGDAALLEYTARFDGVELQPGELRVPETALREAAAHAPEKALTALREAIRRVRAFHKRQRESGWSFTDEAGTVLGQRVRPIERAGLYVPGGTASYPSSVVMNVVPAQVAGVREIVVVTPPRALQTNPSVAAALCELGVTEVYQIGGAQAVAALALGTETVPKVDKITGPGNKFVTAAKKLVFGAVGIDSLAGPSEVLIIADDTARPACLAADLLAQAEHGADASAILVTNSLKLAQSVAAEVETQLNSLPRRALAAASLHDYGAVFLVETLDEACALADELAPEHLEIACENADEIAANINHAGAIFLGHATPEALGDYLAGPNHVLPTGGTARFASALGVYDFVKRTSLLQFTPAEARRLAPLVAALAEAENLIGHARSATAR
jgi:histidinol dehydrogenase